MRTSSCKLHFAVIFACVLSDMQCHANDSLSPHCCLRSTTYTKTIKHQPSPLSLSLSHLSLSLTLSLSLSLDSPLSLSTRRTIQSNQPTNQLGRLSSLQSFDDRVSFLMSDSVELLSVCLLACLLREHVSLSLAFYFVFWIGLLFAWL
jgi:hypothetical protein